VLNDPGGYSAQFAYAPDRSRWRQVSSYAGGTETTLYVGGLLEKLTTATRTHWKHRIATPSGEVQVVRRSDGTSEVLYFATDQLGSTEAVLGAGGTVLMRGSFDVHGTRRAADWQGSPSSAEWQAIANTTRRGFTGHEMLDNVTLIHMNGRVFDPRIGRFLSADPYVDGPDSTQGWNRFAYVHGRVMTATDPTGYALQWGSDRPPVNAQNHSPMGSAAPAGVEEVTVTASRLYPSLGSLDRLNLQMGVTQAAGRGAGGGAGGSGGNQGSPDNKKARTDDCSANADAPKGLLDTNALWRNNSDPNKFVTYDARKMFLLQLSDWSSDERAAAVVVTDRGAVLGGYFVHGQVTLDRSSGSVTILDQPYDFEMHDVHKYGNPLLGYARNLVTRGGAAFANAGSSPADPKVTFTQSYVCSPNILNSGQ
jgi:RHS repeat-associated protein